MLRLLVLVLLLANGLYFAWAQGLLRGYGYGPVEQREGYRLEQQVNPDKLRVLSDAEGRRVQAEASAPAPAAASGAQCLEAGPFTDTQAVVLRQAAQVALPEGSWQMDTFTQPARWIVYMGKYPDPQALARKRAELVALRVRFEPLANAELEPGLSLGGFTSEAQATRELANLARKGINTAHVVQERPAMQGFQFRIKATDEAVRKRLDELRNALAGKALRGCA